MRRRVLVATLSALAVAVVLLGVPLTILAGQIVRTDTLSDLQSRTDTAARALELRYERGEDIEERVLVSYLGTAPGAPEYIRVRLPDGTELSVGEPPPSAYSATRVTESGIVVIMLADRWEVYWEVVRVVALVIALSLVAVIAGVWMARWQANRLAAPLVYLAASAEQLGAGHVRLKMEPSGVEEIDMVAEELERSADRMAARLATERQFASDASHQLRTPLTALTMRLEEIAALTKDDAVRSEAEASLEQVERLVGVVDELLGRSRSAAGSGTQVVALADVLDQQREEWEPAFAKAGRRLSIGDADEEVFATPGALAQVLATLIENSLIHGDGTTHVSARASGQNQAVVVEVRDEGPGVPEDLAPRIFERAVTSGKGTGLGLALARDLVAADGGRLELSQRVPAAFSVFLQGVPVMVDPDTVVAHGRKRKSRRAKGS
jgi:signal transduction histidine kinase